MLDLTQRSTVYERYEIVDRQGQVVERRQRGYPFVFRRGLGVVPIDLEHPVLDDGSTISVTTTGHVDDQGRWHRVIRYRRLPGQTPDHAKARMSAPAVMSPRDQSSNLKTLLVDQRPLVPVTIQVRDLQHAHALPPRAMTGLAFTEHHRVDTLTPLRRKLRAANHERRTIEAGPLKTWIRSVGGRLGHHGTLYGSMLSAWIPRSHMKELLRRPEVAKVEPRATEPHNEDTVTQTYLCTGVRSRWDSGRDTDKKSCRGSTELGVYNPADAYLDAANAATGTLEYVNAGYDGMIRGGLSTWSHEPLFSHEAVPLLTYGVRDWEPLEVNHPAFLWNKITRFQFVLYAEKDGSPDDATDYGTLDVDIKTEVDIAKEDFERPDPTSGDEAHATRCAAVAMAKPYSSSDPALPDQEARDARSGVARRVAGLAAVGRVQVYEMLDIINGGKLGESSDGEVLEGIDVISSSSKEGHGEKLVGAGWHDGDLRCPSVDDTRGLDVGSQTIVWAFYNDSVVFTKAGGNDHTVSSACSVPYEISAPGASPAAISSSALDTSDMTAAEIQGAVALLYDTNRETTPDGRSYPLLASVAQTCGCASSLSSADGSPTGYEHHGHTSATAPRVAGTALLFKHWDLEQHGSIANSAGRTIVNVLHFADGYAWDWSPLDRVHPPAPGWGLGRLRMRLYPEAQADSALHWGTTSELIGTDSFRVIDITDELGSLPTGVRHLRITAWWLEVNTGTELTGENEPKADIRLSLIYWDKDGDVHFDEVASGTEHVLRLQYDRYDTLFSCPPSGDVYLCLWSGDVPLDRRPRGGPAGTLYDVRNVHVAWFWETTDDPTEILCSGERRVDRCVDPAVTVPGDTELEGDYVDGDATAGTGEGEEDDEVTVPGGGAPAGGYSDGDAVAASGRGSGEPYSIAGRESAALRGASTVAGARSGHMRAAADAAVRGALLIATGIVENGGVGPAFRSTPPSAFNDQPS